MSCAKPMKGIRDLEIRTKKFAHPCTVNLHNTTVTIVKRNRSYKQVFLGKCWNKGSVVIQIDSCVPPLSWWKLHGETRKISAISPVCKWLSSPCLESRSSHQDSMSIRMDDLLPSYPCSWFPSNSKKFDPYVSRVCLGTRSNLNGV